MAASSRSSVLPALRSPSGSIAQSRTCSPTQRQVLSRRKSLHPRLHVFPEVALWFWNIQATVCLVSFFCLFKLFVCLFLMQHILIYLLLYGPFCSLPLFFAFFLLLFFYSSPLCLLNGWRKLTCSFPERYHFGCISGEPIETNVNRLVKTWPIDNVTVSCTDSLGSASNASMLLLHLFLFKCLFVLFFPPYCSARTVMHR